MTKHGELLVDFHHRLLDTAEVAIEKQDINDALHDFGGPEQYYVHLMAHFVCHGVNHENDVMEGDDYGPGVKIGRDHDIASRIVLPAIAKIRELFGVPPLIVRLYPPQQTPEEDLWWWRYPKPINDFIVADLESKGYKIVAS